MKRKILLGFLGALLLITSKNHLMAKIIPISQNKECLSAIYNDSCPKRIVTSTPSVDFENDTLFFYSNSRILSMDVVIKDSKGKAFYHNYVSIIDGVSLIKLSEDESSRAFTIELHYANHHLAGYIIRT